MLQKKKKLSLILIIAILSAHSKTTIAAENQETKNKGDIVIEKCTKAVESCKATVEAKNKEIQLKDLAITTLSQQNANLKVEADSNKDELKQWYRNPIVVGILGIITGVAVGTIVTNK